MIAQDMLNNHDLRYFSVGKAGKKITQMDHTDKSLSNSTAPHVLLSKFKAQQRIELGEALDLILRAKAILSRGNKPTISFKFHTNVFEKRFSLL